MMEQRTAALFGLSLGSAGLRRFEGSVARRLSAQPGILGKAPDWRLAVKSCEDT